MKQKNQLTASTRAALAQAWQMPKLTVRDLCGLATLAKSVNESAITFLANLPPAPTEQYYIALQLLRAAFDHGRGLLHLLESNPMDMGGPALALHRSQIENFLRGIYLGFLASSEQVEDYLENDQGIREKNHNAKWQPVGAIALAKRVEGFINTLSDEPLEDPEKLSQMVSNAWSPLCGFVHGGRAIHALYEDGQGQIGADIPLDSLVQIVSNCFVITNFGFLALMARVYSLEGIPLDSPLSIAMQNFIERHRSLQAKYRRTAPNHSS